MDPQFALKLMELFSVQSQIRVKSGVLDGYEQERREQVHLINAHGARDEDTTLERVRNTMALLRIELGSLVDKEDDLKKELRELAQKAAAA